MSPAREQSGSPYQRMERMLALALATCGVERARLAMVEPDPQVLQVRRLAAWLMRQRADVLTFDAAAMLGVSLEFINHAVFTARRRIAAQGIRIDGPVEEVAAVIAKLFAPGDGEPEIAEAAGLGEIRDAVLAAFAVTQAALVGDGRGAREARARQAFAWLAELLTPAAPKEIGRWINRERSTVDHAISRAERIAGAAELRRQVLADVAGGRPTQAALNGFATALERLGRPSPQPR
jgi:hypothetical protein